MNNRIYRGGAAEARRAHNPKVNGSKPFLDTRKSCFGDIAQG